MADGSVEIRISGSLDPSVTASANEAKAAISGLGDATSISAKAMAAALASAGGNLKAITPEMLGLGAAAKTAAATQEGLAAATAVQTAATAAGTRTINSSRAAYESLALVHEALSGRFTRMVGTSSILAQALAGQAATTSAVAFVTSAMGASILGAVAAIGLITAATISFESEEKKLTATAVGLGAQSGLTADQLKKIGEAADSSSQSVRETTKAAEEFAAAGVRDEGTVKELSNSIEAFSRLTGVKFAQAQKTLAEAMKDPVKGAKDLHDQLGILDGAQLEEIDRLVALGDKTGAQIIITQAYIERIREAKQAGADLTAGFGSLINVLSDVYEKIGQVSEGFGREAETIAEDLIPGLHRLAQAHRDAAAAAQHQIDEETQLNVASAKGAKVYDETPEGELKKALLERKGALDDASAALAADTKLYGAHSEKVAEDKVAIDAANHALQTYRSEIQKKVAIDQLDVQLAAAKHAHNKQLVADLTEQIALIQESGKYETAADAKAQAAGKGDVAGARTFAPKGGKGPSIVSEWEEQLHAAEVASNNFFQDQTEKELAFWQAKVGLVKTGSKQWLDVQSKIYEAQKTLAHRDYDEHIADLNDRLEADRDDFKKFQADWQEKLDFIKSKNGEESTQYKDAHRQMEAEERQHQEKMVQEELSGNNKEITALRQHLAAMRQLRQTEASTTEALIKDQSEGEVLGEVKAATQIAQVHQQLAEQEIADAQAVFDKEEALRQQGLRDALSVYGADSAQYRAALQQDVDAYQAFQDQIRQLAARSTQQQIADIIAVKNAYAGYISGTVNATITGLDGMLSKTMTWRQAVIGVYQSIVQSLEAALAKMVTRWIVEHVLMTSAQRAQLAIQNAQHAASEAAKTAATTAGATTRAGIENADFFTRMLALLGINLGHHVATEAGKTAATTTGATTRAVTETTAAASSAAAQHAINANMVISYSGVAGAAGTASFAAAPWPIDMGAPAFGAAMAADAGSYAALAALDTGTNYLPRDMIVQAHEGERVIPKADNRQLMDALRVGGAGGDVHLHYAPSIHERERMGLRQLLASEGAAMIDFLHQSARDGKLNKIMKAAA